MTLRVLETQGLGHVKTTGICQKIISSYFNDRQIRKQQQILWLMTLNLLFGE